MKKEDIFASVVSDSAASPEANTVLALHIVIVVVPIADADVNGNGLNS